MQLDTCHWYNYYHYSEIVPKAFLVLKLESFCGLTKFWHAFKLFYFLFVFQVGQPSVCRSLIGNNVKPRLLYLEINRI